MISSPGLQGRVLSVGRYPHTGRDPFQAVDPECRPLPWAGVSRGTPACRPRPSIHARSRRSGTNGGDLFFAQRFARVVALSAAHQQSRDFATRTAATGCPRFHLASISRSLWRRPRKAILRSIVSRHRPSLTPSRAALGLRAVSVLATPNDVHGPRGRERAARHRAPTGGGGRPGPHHHYSAVEPAVMRNPTAMSTSS